jgi:hypothetical protein
MLFPTVNYTLVVNLVNDSFVRILRCGKNITLDL